MQKFLLLFLGSFLFASMVALPQTLKKIRKEIKAKFAAQPGVFALAFKDLQNGKTLYINEHEIFHAASAMKTAVLIEACRQAAEGKFSITDSVTIFNTFRSIADTSHFSLNAADDSETGLYQQVGAKTSLYDLLCLMITRSSNLATNIVIEKLGAENVTNTLRNMGAHDIKVLRGVEDGKAFEKGLNNVVSAYDLALLFEQMAMGKVVSENASRAMIKILLDQQFNDIIPAKLPAEVKVAHKTGFITGIHHDSGIVFLPNGRKYVLVLLSKNLADDKAGIETMAGISEIIYKW